MKVFTLTVCVLGAVMTALPALAASPCAANYQPYSFQGTVAETGKTADGQPWYVISNIPNPACGDEHQQIRAFPLAAVVACMVGKHIEAKGIYTKSCVNIGTYSSCLAQVGLRNPQGQIDTVKGATISCK